MPSWFLEVGPPYFTVYTQTCFISYDTSGADWDSLLLFPLWVYIFTTVLVVQFAALICWLRHYTIKCPCKTIYFWWWKNLAICWLRTVLYLKTWVYLKVIFLFGRLKGIQEAWKLFYWIEHKVVQGSIRVQLLFFLKLYFFYLVHLHNYICTWGCKKYIGNIIFFNLSYIL